MARRSKRQRERDFARIAELYLRGRRQADIATELGVTQQQISKDLRLLRRCWLESAAVDTAQYMGEELARISHLECTYWQAWERSIGERRVQNTERRRSRQPEAEVSRAAIRIEDSPGDSRFLHGVQWCIDRRCKLVQLGPPNRIAPTDPSGSHEYQHVQPTQLTDKQRAERIIEIFNRIKDGA